MELALVNICLSTITGIMEVLAGQKKASNIPNIKAKQMSSQMFNKPTCKKKIMNNIRIPLKLLDKNMIVDDFIRSAITPPIISSSTLGNVVAIRTNPNIDFFSNTLTTYQVSVSIYMDRESPVNKLEIHKRMNFLFL